jgi:antagonist of KipI
MIVTKSGIFASFQSLPDPGEQWAGISPGGAADIFSFSLLNLVLGNNENESCIEFYFPGIKLLFQEDCIFCLAGADFCPYLDDKPLKNLLNYQAKSGQVLTFKKKINGNVGYFGVKGGFNLENKSKFNCKILSGESLKLKFKVSDFKFANISNRYFEEKISRKNIRFVPDNEYFELESEMTERLNNSTFEISHETNRMGIRILGPEIKLKVHKELTSVPVTKGTIQLLPDGNLTILMADSQVTGGYPRLGFISAVDIDVLAQKYPREKFNFKPITITESRELIKERNDFLKKLESSKKLATKNL